MVTRRVVSLIYQPWRPIFSPPLNAVKARAEPPASLDFVPSGQIQPFLVTVGGLLSGFANISPIS